MKRKCLIHAMCPITCFTVPIIGCTELNLTDEEIYKCLCAKAEIKEILPDGKMISLDFSNYKSIVIDEKPSIKVTETVKESTVKEVVIKETNEIIEEEITLEEDNNEDVKEEINEISFEESPVKTHEVPSRNKQAYKKNKKNKR